MYQYGDPIEKWREHTIWWIYFWGYHIKDDKEKTIEEIFSGTCDIEQARDNVYFLLKNKLIHR